jgi:hypothetical protein
VCGLASAAAEIESTFAATGATGGWAADFGLRNILVQKQPKSAHATLVFKDINAWGSVTSPHSLYSPPGSGLFGDADEGEVQNRWFVQSSNIWAFGCLLCELLVWMVYGPDELRRFKQDRATRYKQCTSRAFHSFGEPSVVVESWLSKLEAEDNLVYQKLAQLIRQMLMIRSVDRPSIQDVHMALRFVAICALSIDAAKFLENSQKKSKHPQAEKETRSFIKWVKSVTEGAKTREAIGMAKDGLVDKITASSVAFEEFCDASFGLCAEEFLQGGPSPPVVHTRVLQIQRLVHSGDASDLSRSVVLDRSRSKDKQRLLSIGKYSLLLQFHDANCMLDGGGVRGICCLRIMHEIMQEVEKIEVESYPESAGWPRLPCHYFELAGGTSTGGYVLLCRMEGFRH